MTHADKLPRRAALALLATLGLPGPPAGAAVRHARAVRPPPPHAAFSYQIGGAFSPGVGVSIIDRDHSQKPVPGRYNICYLNGFQAQADERPWWLSHHRSLLLSRRGRPVIDRGWNEQLLDTSTAARRRGLARIIGGWVAGCVRSGFQAVELDNLDSYTRSAGTLTPADNLALAGELIAGAHRAGLAVGQKNAPELAARGRRLGFDFAIAEECQAYGECGAYTRHYGRRVIEIEYPDNGGFPNFLAACRARGAQISIILRDRDVRPAAQPGYLERRCPGR